MSAPSDPDTERSHPPGDAAREALDDAFISDDEHRSIVDHIFFRASQQISHEQSQAIARITITLLVTVFLLVNLLVQEFATSNLINFSLGIGYTAYGVFHLFWVRRSRDRHLWRRYLVIFGDLGFSSYVTHQFGLAGLGFYPLFLWIMIGNGLRFGPHYLRVATLVGVSGFLIANGLDGVLTNYPGIVVGLVVGLILMPKFFLVMIHRLAEANIAMKRQKEEAEHLARHDVLTGLPNRALLEDRLNRTLTVAARRGTHAAVIFLDLDGFKAINDSYGHEYGDLLLKQIADCLQASVRASDTVARLGGDEFIILMEEARGSEQVAAIVEQLFHCSGRTYTLGEHQAFVTWSCGVAIYPQDGTDSQTLIKNADTAMYRAKEAGSNLFRLYDTTMSNEVTSQLKLRDDLRRAVTEDQFEILFQPQFRCSDRQLVGAEALLRWRHPEQGLLPPSEFFGVAERCGLIQTIGRMALKKTLAAMEQWRRDGLGEVEVFASVSPHQLNSEGFLDQLLSLLESYPLAVDSLGLEVSEGAFIEETPATARLFETLWKKGIRIALDNFGRGNSALSYLTRLRIDRIKIDPILIADIPHHANANKLMEAILDIGNRFELEVLADGVETREQLAWLEEHRCTLVQGYLLEEPLDAAAFSTYLRESATSRAG